MTALYRPASLSVQDSTKQETLQDQPVAEDMSSGCTAKFDELEIPSHVMLMLFASLGAGWFHVNVNWFGLAEQAPCSPPEATPCQKAACNLASHTEKTDGANLGPLTSLPTSYLFQPTYLLSKLCHLHLLWWRWLQYLRLGTWQWQVPDLGALQ